MPGLLALTEPEAPQGAPPQARGGLAGLLQPPATPAAPKPVAPPKPAPPAVTLTGPVPSFQTGAPAPEQPPPLSTVRPPRPAPEQPLTFGQRVLASPWLAPIETAARAYETGALRPIREAMTGIARGAAGPFAGALTRAVPGTAPQIVQPGPVTPKQRTTLEYYGMTPEQIAEFEKPRETLVGKAAEFVGWAVPGHVLGFIGAPLEGVLGPAIGRAVGQEMAGPLARIASGGIQGALYGTVQSIADRHDELSQMPLADAARTIAMDAGLSSAQFAGYSAAFEALAGLVRAGRLTKPAAEQVAKTVEAAPAAAPARAVAEPQATYGPSTAEPKPPVVTPRAIPKAAPEDVPEPVAGILRQYTVDTATGVDEGRIYGAAFPKGKVLTATHVTDNPDLVRRELVAGSDISRTGRAAGIGDLGQGFYVSDAPQVWMGRSQSQFRTVEGLSQAERARLAAVMKRKITEDASTRYITQPEAEVAIRDLDHFANMEEGLPFLSTVLNQPYNIKITDEMLQEAGIAKRVGQPNVVPVEIQGKFFNASDLGYNDRRQMTDAAEVWGRKHGFVEPGGTSDNLTARGLALVGKGAADVELLNAYLRAQGYDGMYTKSGMGTSPQLVLWNPSAVRSFGDWRNPRPYGARVYHAVPQATEIAPATMQRAEALAAQAAPIARRFLTDARGVAEDVDAGVRFADELTPLAIKSPEGIARKLARGRTPTDIVRGTLEIRDPAADPPRVAAALKARGYEVVEEVNRWTDPQFKDWAYKDVALKVRLSGDPNIQELLLVTPSVLDQKMRNGGHAIYEVRRRMGDLVAEYPENKRVAYRAEQVQKMLARVEARVYGEAVTRDASAASISLPSAIKEASVASSMGAPALSKSDLAAAKGLLKTLSEAKFAQRSASAEVVRGLRGLLAKEAPPHPIVAEARPGVPYRPEVPPARPAAQAGRIPQPEAVGARFRAETPAGTAVEGDYAIVSARRLVASHDTDLRPNAAYPQERQPRMRERDASRRQLEEFVGNPRVEVLGASAEAARGAPIVDGTTPTAGGGFIVDSGNMRAIGIQRLYETNHPNAARYRDFVRSEAARVGISPAAVDRVPDPVLVRVRTTPVDVLQFNREANVGTKLEMSAEETARAEAVAKGVRTGQVPEVVGPQTVLSNLAGEAGSVNIPGPIVRAGEAVRDAADVITESRRDVVVSREVGDDLYRLRTNQTADQIRARQLLERTRMTPADAEALYHYDENPREPLTPQQRQMYDQDVRPLAQDSARIFEKLRGRGVPIPEEYYTPRFVANRGGPLDRMLAGTKTTLSTGSLLSRTASALQHRNMYAFIDEQGNATVGAIKGRSVYLYRDGRPVKIGNMDAAYNELNYKDQQTRFKAFTDRSGTTYLISQATTRQIEGATPIRYHKNVLANRLLNWLRLREAERASDYLEALKDSPEFNGPGRAGMAPTPDVVAMKIGEGAAPENWRTTKMLQFRGYVMEPRVAAELDRFADKMNRDPEGILGQANSFLRTAIFFNAFIHTPNIGVHWLVNRGIAAWASPAAYTRLSETLGKAINAVIHQNEDYTKMLERGAPLLSADMGNRELYQLLLQKMGRELQQQPALARQIAGALGYANPFKLVRALYRFSSKATWVVNDVAMLQAIYEHQATHPGQTVEHAIAEVGKHIPNYRIPATVLGSQRLATFMANPTFQMFGGYHYGALRSYGEMMRSLVKGPSSERFEVLDKIAMMGLVGFVIYPFLDTLAQRITGSTQTRVRRAGALTFPYNVYRLSTGQIDAVTFWQSVLTPSVGIKEAAELAWNRDLFTGRHIYDPEDIYRAPLSAAKAVGKELLTAVSPVGYAERIQSGRLSPRDFFLSLLGVTTPTASPANRRLQALVYDRRPEVFRQVEQMVMEGKVAEAASMAREFNRRLMDDSRQALGETGRPVPPDFAKRMERFLITAPTTQEMQRLQRNKRLQPVERMTMP